MNEISAYVQFTVKSAPFHNIAIITISSYFHVIFDHKYTILYFYTASI